MEMKKYQLVSRALTIALAIMVAMLFTVGFYMLAVICIVVVGLITGSLRHKVKEVLMDERDMLLAGTSSAAAVTIFCWVAVMLSMSLYSLADLDPSFGSIAMALSYSALALMVLQAVASRFPGFFKLNRKFWAAAFIGIAAVAVVGVAAIKLSLLGYWSCENGQWVKHNEPSVVAPDMACPIERR